MRASEKDKVKFTVTEKFKTRASELLNESHAMQFAEGLRLNHAAGLVFKREEYRLLAKFGPDDPRVKEMSLRAEASDLAKADLFSRYKDAMTPQTSANRGWVVDGFVRGPDGRGLEGLTVAPHDRQENRIKDLGQATTNADGHFTITVEKLPEDAPKQVFMRALKGRTPLPSNDVILEPKAGVSERVEIIVGEREKDPKPGGDKPPDKPTDKTVDGPTGKPTEKPTYKPTEKPIDKAVAIPVDLKEKPALTKKTTARKKAKPRASKSKAKPAAKKAGKTGKRSK